MGKRSGFIFYYSFWEAISELPDENQLELYKAITNYSFNFEEPNFSGINKTVWILIKPQLEANNRRYENSKKGGAPKGNKNAGKDWDNTSKQPNNNQETTNKQPKEKEKEKENVKAKEKAKEKEKDFYIIFKKGLGITHTQYDKLVKDYGEEKVDKMILELENYIVNNPKGKNVKDCNLTIRTWIRRNQDKQKKSGIDPNNLSDEQLGILRFKARDGKKDAVEYMKKHGLYEKYGEDYLEKCRTLYINNLLYQGK